MAQTADTVTFSYFLSFFFAMHEQVLNKVRMSFASHGVRWSSVQDLQRASVRAIRGARSSLVSSAAALLLLAGLGSPVWAADVHITQGVVEFAAPADLGSGNIVFDGPMTYDLMGAALRWAPGNTADISDRAIFGRPNFDTNGNDVTFAHAIFAGANSYSLGKLGAGTLTLAGDNYFEEGVTVRGGTLAVSGKLSVPDSLTYGFPGIYTLYVNGGTLNVTNGTLDSGVNYFGGSSGTTSTMTLSNSTWTGIHALYVGGQESGATTTLNITNGSHVDADLASEVIFGSGDYYSASSVTKVALSGASTFSTSTTVQMLGNTGPVELRITEGSKFTAPFSSFTMEAPQGSGEQTLTVDGAGSVFTVDRFYQGFIRSKINVLNGGRIETGAFTRFQSESDINGPLSTVTISGPGSIWRANGDFYNAAILQVRNGGTLSVERGDLSLIPYNTVADPGSVLEATGSLKIFGEVYNGGTIRARKADGTLLPITVASLTIGGTYSDQGGGTIEASELRVASQGGLKFRQNNTFSLSVPITGVGGVVMSGTGTTILTGASTYTGATDVEHGALVVNGSLSGTTSIVTGSTDDHPTLGGTGSIQTFGATLSDRSTLAPGATGFVAGAGPETLAINNVLLDSGSTLAIDLDSSAPAGQAADMLLVSNRLQLSSGLVYLKLNDMAANPVPFGLGTTFSLVNYSFWDGNIFTLGVGPDSLRLADGATFTMGLNTWLIDYDATVPGVNFSSEAVYAHSITITAVPEPGSLSALLAGAATLALYRHRRRR